MAIHLEQSSSGYGAFHTAPVELPEFEFPSAVPEPVPGPEPETTPEPTPIAWVQNLPATDFGPAPPDHGTPPGLNALNELAQPAIVELIVVNAAPAAATAAAPAAAPTATPAEIATLELFLADPLNRELVRVHGGALSVLDNGEVTQGQVARYGADLTARLSQLAQANTAVRKLYLEAMDEAARSLGPGAPGAVFVPGGFSGGDGDFVADGWRFDPVAFTQAYAEGGTQQAAPLAQRAFAGLYGSDALVAWERRQGGRDNPVISGYTLAGSFELSVPTLTALDGHPNRERIGWTNASLNPDSHELRPLSMHAPPELHHPQAVWFDATLGWVTPGDNVVVRADFVDKAIPVVVAIAAAWAVGPYAAQMGASAGATGGSFVAGAVKAGVIAAASSTAMQIAGTGSLDFGQLVKTTLSGALTGGLVQGLGIAQNLGSASFSTRVMAMTAQPTVQGAIQEVMGGRFRDGFTSGMASGLAAEITQALGEGLGQAGLSPMQQGVATMLTRATGSAIRALASSDDAQQSFALDFLGSLVGSGLDEAQTWTGTRDQSAAETVRLARSGTPKAANPTSASNFALLPGLAEAGTSATGLRLSPAAAAEFQTALQDGIDRAAADPNFDPSTYTPQRLAQLLAQAGDQSSYSGSTGLAEGEPDLLAGPGGPRPMGSSTTGPGLQFNINQRVNTVFEALGNAPVGDAFGVIPEAYRDIKLLGPLMQDSRLRGEIERMRTTLGQSGFDVTPEKLGAVPGIDASGRISYDPVDLADRYANAIRLLELKRQGVVELDMTNFRVTSVGTSRIAPEVLVRNVEERYQAAFAMGIDEAEQTLAAGERLRYPMDMPQQLQVGLFADNAAKNVVRDYLRNMGVPEGPGQIVALNRWAYDQQGSGLYVRPDVLFDFGPNHRHWIDGKSSFVNSGVLPQQLSSFFEYIGSQTGTVATRDGNFRVRAPRGRP